MNQSEDEDAADNRDDFLCSCCYNLMTQPTSLMCGHNFCRGCLARWYLTSKKKECPTCRQKWQGQPKVNITLRNIMERMFKEQVKQLEIDLENDEDTKSKLNEFDRQLQNVETQSDPKAFCSGIFLTLMAILVVYLAWYWRNSDRDLLIHKPLWLWKPDDVSRWLSELTWAEPYANYIIEDKIDGSMLIAFDETSLKQKLHIANPLHLKALLIAIQGMTESGVKVPSNLWEYKSQYPGRSLFLLYGLKDFPRTTILYTYLFQYEEVFLPFLHYTTPSKESEYVFTEPREPATWQLLTFIMYTVVLPYWLVGKFSWLYFDVHRVTSVLVMISCILLSFLEVSVLRSLVLDTNRFRSVYEKCKSYVKMLASMSIFVILWPVIPRLICDFFFYAALYFSSLQLANQVKNNIVNQNL